MRAIEMLIVATDGGGGATTGASQVHETVMEKGCQMGWRISTSGIGVELLLLAAACSDREGFRLHEHVVQEKKANGMSIDGAVSPASNGGGNGLSWSATTGSREGKRIKLPTPVSANHGEECGGEKLGGLHGVGASCLSFSSSSASSRGGGMTSKVLTPLPSPSSVAAMAMADGDFGHDLPPQDKVKWEASRSSCLEMSGANGQSGTGGLLGYTLPRVTCLTDTHASMTQLPEWSIPQPPVSAKAGWSLDSSRMDFGGLVSMDTAGDDCADRLSSPSGARSPACPREVKGPWSIEEDQLLRTLVEKMGPRRWSFIAERIPGRTGKQARERWLNQLSPQICKRPWTDDEDRTILSAHAELGNRWSEIARRLNGRTDNAVKNRYNSFIRKAQIRRPLNSMVDVSAADSKSGTSTNPDDSSVPDEGAYPAPDPQDNSARCVASEPVAAD